MLYLNRKIKRKEEDNKMKIELDFDFTIRSIVEFSLHRNTGNSGLLIPIKMSYDYYGKDDNEESEVYHITKWVYLLFHRPNNYTRVFSFVSDKPLIIGCNISKEVKWHLECDHDSCWSSDGFRFIKQLKDKIIDDFLSKEINYREIYEMVLLEEMKYVELNKYEYNRYGSKDMSINFKF
jgi:hypothetical protein